MKLLERLEHELDVRRWSPKTIAAHRRWVKRFVRFQGMRIPNELGPDGVRAYPKHLAVREPVAESTQIQALCALVFLYQHVLQGPLGEIGEFARPSNPQRLPVVLSNLEARRILVSSTIRRTN